MIPASGIDPGLLEHISRWLGQSIPEWVFWGAKGAAELLWFSIGWMVTNDQALQKIQR